MSGTREISEQKANALNFLNPVLSTNQRPRFWALNQWEASISGPPILTHFQNQTAISAIRQSSKQQDCNLSNHTAILLHSSLIVEIAVRLWRLQSDCWGCSLIAEVAVWLLTLQSDCWECRLIFVVQPMGGHYFRSSNFDSLPKSDYNLSNQIPSQRLQSDCWYCSVTETPWDDQVYM